MAAIFGIVLMMVLVYGFAKIIRGTVKTVKRRQKKREQTLAEICRGEYVEATCEFLSKNTRTRGKEEK